MFPFMRKAHEIKQHLYDCREDLGRTDNPYTYRSGPDPSPEPQIHASNYPIRCPLGWLTGTSNLTCPSLHSWPHRPALPSLPSPTDGRPYPPNGSGQNWIETWLLFVIPITSPAANPAISASEKEEAVVVLVLTRAYLGAPFNYGHLT